MAEHAGSAADHDADLVGQLRFGRAQYGLLGLLVSLVGLIAAVGYQSTLQVGRDTEALNDQLQFVSGDMISLERQVLSFALVVERWVAEDASTEELDLTRSLVERQYRITASEAAADRAMRSTFERLTVNLGSVDGLVAQGRPEPGTPRDEALTSAVDEMVDSVKKLIDLTEARNFELVHTLEDGLRNSRRTEFIVAGLIASLVIGLLVSMRRIVRKNYGAARSALRREQDRHETVRIERARVEYRYREVVDEVSDVVFRCDDEGRFTLLNRAWTTLTTIPIDEALGRPAVEICHPDDRDRVQAALIGLIDGSRSQGSEEMRLVRPDGVQRTVVVSARTATDDEAGRYIAGTINDVTAQARARHLAEAQTEILEMIALDTPVDAVLSRIVELVRPHAPGVSFRFVTDPADHLPGSSGSRPLTDLSRGEPIGSLCWSGSIDDEPGDFEAVVRLVTQLGTLAIDRHLAAGRVAHQATHDALSGLPNRSLLVDRISTGIARAARNDTRLAVLFLDVDRFKVVNDSLGHRAGDRLLVVLADRIAAAVRTTDTVARFGGDEFVVLVEPLPGPDELERIAERILAAVATPVDLGGQSPQVTTSIGIVIGDGESEVDELLKNADVAMYRAKQAGRATYQTFDTEMREWAQHRNATELALRGALGRGEMEVWYQPLVELASRRLKGYEALVRWRRPDAGIVSPAEFIPIVEELGLINRLGDWVLETAAEQLIRWQREAPDLVMSVNVSGRQIGCADYADKVAEICRQTGVSAKDLVLEITESAILEDTKIVRSGLGDLKSLGVRLAIDDFGTGYSSLQYLRRLSVDIIKIDRAFVSASGAELHDPTIVASVTDLGHAFGLEVVAEGIETEEQREALLAVGVDTGQGYLFGRPQAPAQISPPISALIGS